MVEADVERAGAVPHDIKLNPFGHLPGISSRITGLGGVAPGHDPTYVFHTAYVEVAPGRAEFTVRFEGLTAKQGTLVLRVHMLAQEDGAHALLATSQRVQLNRLVAQNGAVTVSFDAFRGVLYAIYGSLPGDSDVEARSVTISLNRPAGAAAEEELAVDARTSAFGRSAGVPTPRLISLEPPTLTTPATQICTARQLREPIAHRWTNDLGLGGVGDVDRWSSLYVAQALAAFGMLAPGAAGLGFASSTDPLVATVLKRGGSVVLIDPEASEHLRHEGLPLEVRPWSTGSLPNDVINFDFAWSRHTLGATGSFPAASRFMSDVFARLRPGGVVVHTFPYNLDSYEETIEQGRCILFRRRDVERIALTLISNGHEVAQFKIHAADAPEGATRSSEHRRDYRWTMAGIIARKAASQL